MVRYILSTPSGLESTMKRSKLLNRLWLSLEAYRFLSRTRLNPTAQESSELFRRLSNLARMTECGLSDQAMRRLALRILNRWATESMGCNPSPISSFDLD